MATSQFLAFGTGGGSGSPNTLSPSAYAALTTILQNGFVDGVASATQANTIWRQATTGVAGMALFAVDHGTVNALDDGVPANFKAAIKSALDALYIQDLSGLATISQFTGGNQSKTTNGYQKLPGGLIMQWGTYTSDMADSSVVAVSFPIAFPTACLNVSLTTRNPSNDERADSWPEFVSASTTQVSVVRQNLANAGSSQTLHGFTWFAIGH